jgi:MOSC domain-containing protein YiiM
VSAIQSGRVHSINISAERGRAKTPVPSGLLLAGFGIEGDAHAGSGKRQISLLAVERIRGVNVKKNLEAGPGDFAENITTEGIVWAAVPVGAIIKAGAARLRVVGKSKPEHGPGDYTFRGTALLAEEGVFAEVLDGGFVVAGDVIAISEENSS